MLTYPHIDPVAFSIGPLAVHWYGLMYLFAFGLGWALGLYRAKKSTDWTSEQVSDLVFYCALSAVLGGRIGYMLFYQFNEWIHAPQTLLYVWQGGMSFHGGVLGVVLGIWLFAKKHNKTFAGVADFVTPLVPLGLGLGRIGNFINGELWGRVTTVSWGMIFPYAGSLPRHPTQLYEAFGEGILLFLIIWIYSAKPRPPLAVTGLFLLSYGIIRSTIEIFREPDAHIGFIAFGWLTEGQLLSIPMILIGAFLLVWAYWRRKG